MKYSLPLHLGVVAIEKGASGSPSTKVSNFTYNQAIGLMSSVFANSPEDLGRVIPVSKNST